MSRPAVGGSAIQLLLTALETPTARLSAATCRRYPDEAAQLKNNGLIKSAGYEPVGTVEDGHCDAPVLLTWSQDHATYGYFSETAGWVQVATDHGEIFDVDMAALAAALVADLGLPAKSTIAWLPGHLWELGSAYVGGASKRMPILLGRRLHDEVVWRQVETALRNRPVSQRRLLLSSTPAELLPSSPRNCELVSLVDVLAGQEHLTLDAAVLGLRLDGLSVSAEHSPLAIVGDGREVHFFGDVYRFPRGDKQRRMIRVLYDRYSQGDRWVSSAEIAEELDLSPTTRPRDLFKRSKAWGRLLTEKNGMCGFCWPAVAS